MKKVTAKKSLGQHFLTSEEVAQRIAQAIAPDVLPRQYAALPVLEIGPGMGMLTKYLMQQHQDLRCVELDRDSVKYLATLYPGLAVTEGDFLHLTPDDFFTSPFILMGNYPYNISSQIFFWVLDHLDRVPVVAGMLQKEVAERICSAPGSKVYGILSVLLQAWYDTEYLFTVHETVFSPPPKVKSGVIRLVRNARTSLGCDERMFKTVVKTTFGMRRKTLRNSLAGLMGPDSPLHSDPILQKRPEQLGVDDFVYLTNRLR